MVLNQKLYEYQNNFFNIFIVLSYILIIISFLGLSNSAQSYLVTMDYYIRIYICLFLIWRFNPFRKLDKFTDLDRKIAFSAGIFILTTSALNNYLINFKDKILQIVNPISNKKQ
jgi:hypothetical protein